MEQKEVIYTKKDVIENYKPMFTEWSLSKLIREGKIKYIRVGRRISWMMKILVSKRMVIYNG